jgi:hypothetical protein
LQRAHPATGDWLQRRPPTTNSIIPTAFLHYIHHPLQYARSSSYRRFTYSQSSSPPFISWRSTSASNQRSERKGQQPLALLLHPLAPQLSLLQAAQSARSLHSERKGKQRLASPFQLLASERLSPPLHSLSQ